MKDKMFNIVLTVAVSLLVVGFYHVLFIAKNNDQVKNVEVTVSDLLRGGIAEVYKDSFVIGYAVSEGAGDRYIYLRPSRSFKDIKGSAGARHSVSLLIPKGYTKENLKSECLNGWIGALGDIKWSTFHGGYVVENVKRIMSIESDKPLACEFVNK